jgi:2-amino-4-hydroxy-6-hydroxymethyldihydropteridine diphosphokinase
MKTCLIGIGSNLGDRQRNVEAAVERILSHPQLELRKQSGWLSSAPVGGPDDQGEFLNGALAVKSTLRPLDLLDHLLRTERDMGRVREQRWAPRNIDLDLLLVDGESFSNDRLTIPHPWMTIRPFVIDPVAEIAPHLEHPTIGWTMERLSEHLHTAPNRILLISSSEKSCRLSLLSAQDHLPLHVTPIEVGLTIDSVGVASSSRKETSINAARHPSQAPETWEVLTVIAEETRADELAKVLSSAPAVKLTVCVTDGETEPWMVKTAERSGKGPVLALDCNNEARLQHDVKAALEGMS